MEINEIIQVINDVFFVPDLKNNLLSIGQMQEKGLTVIIQHRRCKIYHSKKGLIMETDMTCNKMFAMHKRCPSKEEACFSSVATYQTHLWHCHYGSQLEWTQSDPTKESGERIASVTSSIKDL